MEYISEHVDRGATLANFSQTQGTLPYKTDKHLSNSLKSVIAGSAQYGDSLHAAGLIEHDKCTCDECCQTRHTAYHVYWECARYKKIRETYVKQF